MAVVLGDYIYDLKETLRVHKLNSSENNHYSKILFPGMCKYYATKIISFRSLHKQPPITYDYIKSIKLSERFKMCTKV